MHETLDRLARAGLYQPGKGRIGRNSEGLDLLRQITFTGTRHDYTLMRGVYELCQRMGPELAALAAARVTNSLRSGLRSVAAALDSTEDLCQRYELSFEFWQRTGSGTDSSLFAVITNNLRVVADPCAGLLAPTMAPGLRRGDLYLELAEAIAETDIELSRALARRLLALLCDPVIAVARSLEASH
ncbi:FCD domain-containing protein [Pseudonocardiaceae bacterium YIM PH 21723]|nr:FCD domain-containing protein [Pseudonocardiaceae bacterium YIM PH 21723]